MEILNFQQGTEEWKQARMGVITGTRLKNVMAKPGTKAHDDMVYELIAEVIAPMKEDTYESPAMTRGKIIEEIVKEMYGEEIVNVGMVKKYDWLGISPDGLIYKDGEIRKAVEIKSPEAKNFVRYWIENEIPSEYFWQVVHYFVVIDTLDTLDFIIYNPEIFDEKYRMKVITVTRESLSDKIRMAVEHLEIFRKSWLATIDILTS